MVRQKSFSRPQFRARSGVSFVFAGLVLSGSTLLAAPTIRPNSPSVPTAVNFSQDGSRAVITYTLEEDPAIVTVDIETNTLANAAGEWVSIGGENVQTLSGDVNRLVREVGTTRSIVWRPCRDWPNREIENGIRAVVTAWATNRPPDYLVIGLETQNDVRFYAETNFIPYGISSDYYRTNAIVLRKIPAENVIWRMGSPDTEEKRDAATEILHGVMFTRDFYMAIYETTQGQFSRVVRDSKGNPSNPSSWKTLPDAPMRPVDNVSLQSLRGQTAADGPTAWPESGHTVTSGSHVGKFRAYTGLDTLDLPTEAEWEYACRAGTQGRYNDDSSSPDAVAWYSSNSWEVTNATTKAGARCPHVVGGKRPNDFGLYDMHGNVQEVCLDHHSQTNDYVATFTTVDYALRGVTVDPVGTAKSTPTVHPASGLLNYNQCVIRGGYYNLKGPNDNDDKTDDLRSAIRAQGSYNYNAMYNGFRLCLPAIFN